MSAIKTEQQYREALVLLTILEEENQLETRFAGGCVRDRYLNQLPKDFDIATVGHPQEVCRIFKQKGYRVIPTGIEHGTVSVIGKFGSYEITTLRQDIETDGRHATVRFGQSFEEDAARRDFTMNAMFEDRHGVIYDFFGGKQDLDRRQLQFVGNATERIREDYLRIMRLYRFWARMDCLPNEQTLTAVAEMGAGLARISQERITQELMGILAATSPEQALLHLFDSQIVKIFLPEAQRLTSEQLVRSQDSHERHLSRLALMLEQVHADEQLTQIAKRLKLSNKQHTKLGCLIGTSQFLASGSASSIETAEKMDLIDFCETAENGFFLKSVIPHWRCIEAIHTPLVRDFQLLEETQRSLRLAKIPIESKDVLIQLNLIPGPELGQALTQLKRSYRNGQWRSKDEGMRWLIEHRESMSR
ncbi:MAG: CCA tRNA nucleotidyltransferase [Pseudobacteriovorax sp.]|nr:CCA tRNA nucleotidyltransferase [Pseudobacteriovorax sp.]